MAECLGLGGDPARRERRVAACSAELPGDGYTIEKGAFEAVPGLVVPAHVYRPSGAGPHPGVVHSLGHWMENARLEPDIQRYNARLARAGMLVLAYDTLGQGERRDRLASARPARTPARGLHVAGRDGLGDARGARPAGGAT